MIPSSISDPSGLRIRYFVVRTLMAKLPGLRVYIPHPSRVASIVQQYILQRTREGGSVAEIAAELGLSVRYIRDCLRSASSP